MSAPEPTPGRPGLFGDLPVLMALLRGQGKGGNQQDRLARFYGPQAAHYDRFRQKLLPGREALIENLAACLPAQAHLVEIGAGTGRNLECFPGHQDFRRVDLVDLCDPLLAVARSRWAGRPEVHCHLADACTWRPTEASETGVDAVLFSFSLTMIPNWQGALSNAVAMLRPGGWLAVADFTLLPEQSALARRGWRTWFGHDGVHPNPDHIPALRAAFDQEHRLHTERFRLPYLGLSIPVYRFLGRKPAR